MNASEFWGNWVLWIGIILLLVALVLLAVVEGLLFRYWVLPCWSEKLAERLYVSQGVVLAWEHKRSWPHSSLLPMLAEALHITVEELYLPPEEADG